MYDDIAPSYDELHAAEQRRKLELLLDQADLEGCRSVIDVGCATAHLRAYFPGMQYLGVDPSQPLLDHAPADARTVCANGEDLPVQDRRFDVALSLTALHNYDDPRKGVRELARVTKKHALIGVLKKSAQHDDILDEIRKRFVTEQRITDRHDTLIVAKPRNS